MVVKLIPNPLKRVPLSRKPINRGLQDWHTSLLTADNWVKLDLPWGCFNPAILADGDGYLLAYRPNEYRIVVCRLSRDFQITDQQELLNHDFVTDPRLCRVGERVLMTFTRGHMPAGVYTEQIHGVWLDDMPNSFRISPLELTSRQKNWLPFTPLSSIYFVSGICPHQISYFDPLLGTCKVEYETEWLHPWEHLGMLKGSTPPVLLDDGSYLSTFHTTEKVGDISYYDNFCYRFSGQPAFEVLAVGNKTFLRAEDAIEPAFRKKGLLKCCFPTGMIREGGEVVISFGDNDSSCKLMRVSIEDALKTLVDVY